MRLPAIVVACALLTGGCVYRIEIQQGNYVTQDQVQKLKPGMTRTEVRQALGTPLLQDVFHADRWDYYFSQVRGKNPNDRKLFSVYFKEDKVGSFTGEVQPAAAPPVGVPPPPGLPQAGPPPAPAQPRPSTPQQAPRGPPSSRPPGSR